MITAEKFKYGYTRQDGYRFSSYVSRRGKVYPSFISPESFRKNNVKKLERNKVWRHSNRTYLAGKKREWRKNNLEKARAADRARYPFRYVPKQRPFISPQAVLSVIAFLTQPKPEKPFIQRTRGEVREDGFIFHQYSIRNGKRREIWLRPEVFKRSIESTKKWVSRPENRAAINARARLPENRKKTNERAKNKIATDPRFAVRRRCKSRLQNALKAFKVGKMWNTMQLVGCTIDELVSHIESQFKAGMTWENRSEWHIDHIIPFHMIDVLDEKQLRMVCHYTNLRPLWKFENLTRTYEDVSFSIN